METGQGIFDKTTRELKEMTENGIDLGDAHASFVNIQRVRLKGQLFFFEKKNVWRVLHLKLSSASPTSMADIAR